MRSSASRIDFSGFANLSFAVWLSGRLALKKFQRSAVLTVGLFFWYDYLAVSLLTRELLVPMETDRHIFPEEVLWGRFLPQFMKDVTRGGGLRFSGKLIEPLLAKSFNQPDG